MFRVLWGTDPSLKAPSGVCGNGAPIIVRSSSFFFRKTEKVQEKKLSNFLHSLLREKNKCKNIE